MSSEYIGQLYALLHKLKERFAAVTVCLMLAYMVWRNLDLNLSYFAAAPNRYRMFTQVLLALNDIPLSFTTLLCLSWGLSMAVLCLMVENEKQILLVLVWGVLMAVGGAVTSGPMYPILYQLSVTRNPRYLVPLALLKDHALILGVLFLLLHGVKAWKWILISGGIFLSVFLIIGIVPYAVGAAPLITPVHALINVGGHILPLIGVATLLLLSPFNRLLFLLNVPIVFLFGLFWEPQLWAPLIILEMAE